MQSSDNLTRIFRGANDPSRVPTQKSSYQKTSFSVQVNGDHLKNSKKIIKKEHMKQLNEYRESLEKKIELLKEKLSKTSFYSSSTNGSCQVISLKIQPFLGLLSNEKICLRFISMLNSNDLFRLMSSSKHFYQKIIQNIISKVKSKIVEKYSLKYENQILFSSSKFSLIVKRYKKNRKGNTRIILSVNSTITKENSRLKDCYQISYITKLDNENVITTYTIDIHNNPKLYWIFKEYTDFHYDDFDKAYYNDIIQFSYGDIVNFSVTIFSEVGLINFEDFHWMKPKKVEKTNNNCECEEIKNFWDDISNLKESDFIVKSIHRMFDKYFHIEQIFFDDVGYILLKIILVGKSPGRCEGDQDDNLGIVINVLNKDQQITNEVKKNGLIIDEKNELNIRIDDKIVFYISKSK